jgi:hypothetical protein
MKSEKEDYWADKPHEWDELTNNIKWILVAFCVIMAMFICMAFVQ